MDILVHYKLAWQQLFQNLQSPLRNCYSRKSVKAEIINYPLLSNEYPIGVRKTRENEIYDGLTSQEADAFTRNGVILVINGYFLMRFLGGKENHRKKYNTQKVRRP